MPFEEGIFFWYENLETVNCHYHFDTHEFTRNSIFSLCQLIQLLDCHQHSINRNKKSGFCCTLPLYFYASRLNQRHFCLALYMIFYICTFRVKFQHLQNLYTLIIYDTGKSKLNALVLVLIDIFQNILLRNHYLKISLC